jgi:hypothetical protein
MSGLNENVTAGKDSHDDSSSRHRVAQHQAAKIQGPEVTTKHRDLSLKDFHLPANKVERLSQSRQAYQAWIATLAESLSPEGKALVGTPFFQHLRDVPHSTVAHSRLFSHVDLTRFDHCIHAAHSVHALNQGARLGLSPYETKVLELVLLLHDPHRLGSHALDRVFASMPGAPKNFSSWWPANDFHEYHGAVAAAKDPEVRTTLGKYYGDVMAILTRDDRRALTKRVTDYGHLKSKLSDARLASLKRLEDELDRCSYLKLDYLRSGFDPSLIARAISDVERHEQTLSARGDGIQLNISEQSGDRPYDDVARRRSFYRAELATLPVGCLVEQVIFHNGVWDRAKDEYPASYLSSQRFYEDIRDKALTGRYEEIFSQDALTLLDAAHNGNGLCIEDVYAPLVTLTLADITEYGGMCKLGGYIPPGLAQEYCGVPRRDMTLFESWIRGALQKAGLNTNVHVLTSNDFGKTFEYEVSRQGKAPVRETSETLCHKSLIKVIVAARAIDSDGQTVDLSKVKRVVCDYLSGSGILVDPRIVDNLNPRVFCDPVTPGYFSDTVRANIAQFTPEWIRRGGCGLL